MGQHSSVEPSSYGSKGASFRSHALPTLRKLCKALLPVKHCHDNSSLGCCDSSCSRNILSFHAKFLDFAFRC